MSLLSVHNLFKSFGGLVAVAGVSFEVDENSIVGLIGPNGAGKTTVFNIITGNHRPNKGEVLFDRMDITGRPPHEIVTLGIARTFQNIRLFKGDTVIENVKTAFQSRMKYSILAGILRLPSYHTEEFEIDRRARELLQVFDLERYEIGRAHV